MAEDDYPSYADVEDALLRFLHGEGNPDRALPASAAYGPLADVFNLTPEKRTRPRDKWGGLVWNNRVQWARRKLVERGLMHRNPHGMWRLTDAGRRIAKSHQG